ncbi:bestrophin-like domain [Flavitalea sp.]|nr:hypothetical protein [Flavitalea sp.]
MTSLPLFLQFIITNIVILGSIEVGKRMGEALQRYKKNEKDGMISVISGSILGLLSFMLAFTFGIVSDRHDLRKSLVREEANQIGTVWLRSDFIAEPDRSVTKKLVKEYLDLRISLLKSAGDEKIIKSVVDADRIHDKLWALGISHSRNDLQSDLGALYFDALNKLADIQGLRVAIGYRGHIPAGLWISLYTLLVCAMLSIGYYAYSIQSKRSFASILLAFSFSLVIGIISNLDQLQTKHFEISQQPLLDLQKKINEREL